MRYRHVIWDWNGTLLDDTWLCVEVLNLLLRDAGLRPVTLDLYRAHFGFPVIKFYEWLGFDFAQHSFDAISIRFIAEYNRRRYECRLQPGAREALEHLHAAGLAQSVLSAYREDTLREVITHYGLAGHFTHLSGLDNIHAHGKVDRGRAHLRTLALHDQPQAVILIGDTAHDFEVAAALGTDCLLLHHGHMHAGRLDPHGAPVVASLPDAVDWVLAAAPQ
jgi:phosphoglycolate phosphatase